MHPNKIFPETYLPGFFFFHIFLVGKKTRLFYPSSSGNKNYDSMMKKEIKLFVAHTKIVWHLPSEFVMFSQQFTAVFVFVLLTKCHLLILHCMIWKDVGTQSRAYIQYNVSRTFGFKSMAWIGYAIGIMHKFNEYVLTHDVS